MNNASSPIYRFICPKKKCKGWKQVCAEHTWCSKCGTKMIQEICEANFLPEKVMPRNYTDITILLDRSGSMAAIREATIAGFNKFIADQKETPGAGCFSLIQFDNAYEVNYTAVDQKEVQPLSIFSFVPRGNTALIDSTCRAIDELGARLARTPEYLRPNKVLFVIITDGEENNNFPKYTRSDMDRRIKHQREVYNWQFVYLGANQDAIKVAESYGISRGCAMTYAATNDGATQCYGSLERGTRAWKLDGNSTAEQFFADPVKRV